MVTQPGVSLAAYDRIRPGNGDEPYHTNGGCRAAQT